MMASSDDEADAVPQFVTNYHFVDDKDEPISFCYLPIQWSEDESPDSMETQIFLHGTADSGLQKIYKQVIAWKFELLDEHPEIAVLSKEKNWIKLQKPRKSFEDTIRAILITLHCLHFLKKNPETSGKSLWDHLRKVFSLYELRPSENDLLDHLPLINDAVKHDETLSKSKFLLTFLQNPMKSKAYNEDVQIGTETRKSKFIVDDDEELDEDIEAADEDDSDGEADLFDSVCSICDNGGEILCCEGRCLRSFHATLDDGTDSQCKSLGLSKAQVEAIQNFLCKNCQYKQHQCFACGKLGSSDKSSAAEVFPCVSATCGYFYHPECAAKLLHPGNDAEAEEYQKKIAAGESFTCPVHKCLVCKERENKEVEELHFAVCRRCPRAYHRKCLPRKISFEDLEGEDIITRAWDGLLPNNRILIYCLKHKIDRTIGTPIRNHIIFPNVEERNKTRAKDVLPGKGKVVIKKRSIFSEDSPGEITVSKKPRQVEKVPIDLKDSASTKKLEKHFSGQGFDSSEKPKMKDASRKPFKDSVKFVPIKMDKSSAADERKASLGGVKLNSVLNKVSEPVKSYLKDLPNSRSEKTKLSAPLTKKPNISRPLLDGDTKKRLLAFKEKLSSSITLEEVKKRHRDRMPSTHSYSSKDVVDKMTQGKVEVLVEAIRTALQKSEEGCNVEDAKAVCGPEVLNKIIKWRNKLKVYLAPFLHGMRYTSFGRHFTKVDKLKEIVNKLHPYVQNGDMIVDFCCGANDFSCLLKEKLEETGKRCSFKNYDVIQPKNDFSFEKKDWMTVRTKELPTGSRLIMGLNPPFGVRAALANKFIDKALEFRPKLLILIVPQETERLDKKEDAYDLVWEDNQKLSGKSFYLPGSVDINDKQMEQWNLKPPLLYLWSRSDWTERHKEIALKEGHIALKEGHVSTEQKELRLEEQQNEAELLEQPMDISPVHDYYGDISKLINEYGDESNPINDLPGKYNVAEPEEPGKVVSEDQKESSLPKHDLQVNHNRTEDDLEVNQSRHGDDDAGSSINHDLGKKRSCEYLKVRQDTGKQSRSKTKTPPKNRKNFDRRPQLSKKHKKTPPSVSSPLKRTDSEFGTGYGGLPTTTSIPDEDLDDIARRYSSSKRSIGTSLIQEYGGLRGLEEQFPGNTRDHMDSFSRTAYTREADTRKQLLRLYGQQEVDPSQLLRLYGLQDPDPSGRSGYLPRQDTGFGNMGSLSSSTPYGSTSNAPSSYGRMTSSTPYGSFGTSTPLVGGRSGIFDCPGSQYPPGPPRPGFHHDSIGFPPGPPHPFQ
ncbi:zinc finger protein [Macleaya cordata]|uniref:Zinc finger protein n=1 Tax=Macleaya cordata TaxID=56857 RepID=A0A200QFT9_MACCD|nr:zinc finger protein [Macleaya cordata]